MVFAGKFSVEIGPELLENIAHHIDADLQAELGHSGGGTVATRIVKVGKSDSRRVPAEFGKIDLIAAGIPMGPENLPDGIAEPGNARAGSAPEMIARCLCSKATLSRCLANIGS